MSATEFTEQIQITGNLLSINIFEQKLMRNFYIINSKLKRLDQLQQLDIKLKALQKQQKFINNKMEAMSEKLPKEGPISRNDIKIIVKDQVIQVFNSKDDRLTTSKFMDDVKKEIHTMRVELARVRVEDMDRGQGMGIGGGGQANARASLTAGQILMQDGARRVPREALQDVLDKNQMNVVDNIIGAGDIDGNGSGIGGGNWGAIMGEINRKFEGVYLRLEEMKLGKMFNEYGQKQIQKFEKYQQYELKSQQTTRKLKQKPIRLDGIKRQNIKGEILKNDLYSQYQKAQLIRSELLLKPQRKSLKGQSLSNFKDELKSQIKIIDQGQQKQKEKQKQKQKSRLKPSKSVKKLQRIERRLKLDDIKDINSVLREIQLRIQGRVTHEIFMGFVEDIEEKLEILRVTKDTTNQLSQLRKMLYSLENRLQAVIIFIQNSTNQDDALLVKKQWTCISCDKNLDKYNAKVGQHLNWDNLTSKKISPTKAGAFGQTGQLASKIRTLMQNQKLGQQ